jgi:CheY-like chemotaxis protein
MGLNGRLEDLPLLDIVQVVAFSQKTGYLSLETPRGEAAIVFERGLVVSCFTPETPAIEARVAQLPAGERAALIRKRIETALEELVRLREGQFLFSLTPEVPASVNHREIRAETLEHGIKAEELLLELARGMDEDRRDAAAAVESGFAESAGAVASSPDAESVPEQTLGTGAATATDPDTTDLPEDTAPEDSGVPSLPELEALPEEEGRHHIVLLVDDEADLRAILAGVFIEGRWQVVEAGTPSVALRAARSLQDLGLPFVLVVDRGMPTSDGASFDGGLEVIRRLKQAGFEPPALLMTDRMTRPLHDRGRKLGVARFVFKPSLSRLDPEQFAADIRAFGEHVRDTILPVLEPAAFVLPPESAPEAPMPRTEEAWREAAELQRRLEDLRRPQDAGQVSALVMSMARDFFERGVLFIVKDDELRGLGGFGPAAHDDIILVIREARIPLSEASIFQEVVVSGRGHYGPLPAGRFEALLLDSLGAFAAREAALMPLVTNRETIALLYADNPETGAAMPRLDTLEVFLGQAGRALESAFLQRKRESRGGRGASGPRVNQTELPGGARQGS